jgi:predicted dehydrogenase
MKKQKIGIIGLGYMGLHHLKIFDDMNKSGFLKNTTVDLICDPNSESLQEIAKTYNIKRTTTDPFKVTTDDKINTVIIASPTKYHYEQVKSAVNNKKAIYCEKPLSVNLQQSSELTSIVNKFNIPNQVGLVLRHSPSVFYTKKLLESKLFSKPKMIHYRFDGCTPIGGHYKTLDKISTISNGGGIIKESNVHDFDLLRYLFGDFNVDNSVITRNRNDVDTHLSSNFYFKNDIFANFTSIWHNIIGKNVTRRFEIFCDNGLIIAEDFMHGGIIKYQLKGEKMKTVKLKESQNLYFQEKKIDLKIKQFCSRYSAIANYAFLESLKNNTKCYPSFNEAYTADKIIDKIYNNAKIIKK